jgi:hypothetical protein
MDWIERLFGVAPDSGDGTSEMAILFAGMLALGMVIATRALPVRELIRAKFDVWKSR